MRDEVNYMIIYKPSIDIFMGKSETVKLCFNKEIAHLIQQTVFHHSQRLSILEDGSAEIEMDVGLGVGLAYWVLSFGSMVVVKQPSQLAQAVEQLAKETASRYNG